MLAAKQSVNFNNVLNLLHRGGEGRDTQAMGLIIPVKAVHGTHIKPAQDYVFWRLSGEDVEHLKSMKDHACRFGIDGLSESFETYLPDVTPSTSRLWVNKHREVFFNCVVPGKNGGTVTVASNTYITTSGLEAALKRAGEYTEGVVGYAGNDTNELYLFTEKVIFASENLHRIFYKGLQIFTPDTGSQMEVLCASMIESN